MANRFSTEQFIKQLKSSDFVRGNIPMGYVPGLPILTVLNGNLCMRVPFLKYFVTGEVDNTFVYPVKYLVTVCVPEGNVIGFEDLAFNGAFANVAFTDPIGKFRHDAVKNLDKEAFSALKTTLYEEYDKIIAYLAEGAPYTKDDESTFTALIRQILEPCLHPFYSAIDHNFATKYLK